MKLEIMELKRRRVKAQAGFIVICSCILMVLGFWNIFLYVSGQNTEFKTVFTKTNTSSLYDTATIDPEVLRKEELAEVLSRYGAQDLTDDNLDTEAANIQTNADSLVLLLEDLVLRFPQESLIDAVEIENYKSLDTFGKLLVYPDLYQQWSQMKNAVGDSFRTPFQQAIQETRLIEINPLTINEQVDSVMLDDTLVQTEASFPITGELSVDTYIRNLATQRGYKLRPIANSASLKSFDDQLLHPILIRDWNKLLIESQQDGLDLKIVSGFRSPETQQSLFTNSLEQKFNLRTTVPTTEEILAGLADEDIDAVLSLSSVPGYSKHHTGYTIDINDLSTNQGFTQFKNTDGYDWLIKDNYLRLKLFGFVPSYPVGGTNFGPNPEEWEYSWVGTSILERDFALGLAIEQDSVE